MNVETIEFKDVRGKQLLYLKITSNGKEVLINVGQKTFDSVKELETPTQPELPLTLGDIDPRINPITKGNQPNLHPVQLTDEQKEILRKNMERK